MSTASELRPGDRAVRLDREELDGQAQQLGGPVGHLAVELQGVARLKDVGGAAVAVLHLAGQHVDELRARVLVGGEHLAALHQRHEQRLHPLLGAAHAAEHLVAVPGPRPAVHDLETLPRLYEQDVAFLVEPAEEGRDGHRERPGQPCQRRQAGRGLGVLHLRQHALGQAAELGELADGEAQLEAVLADPLGDDRAEGPLELEGVDLRVVEVLREVLGLVHGAGLRCVRMTRTWLRSAGTGMSILRNSSGTRRILVSPQWTLALAWKRSASQAHPTLCLWDARPHAVWEKGGADRPTDRTSRSRQTPRVCREPSAEGVGRKLATPMDKLEYSGGGLRQETDWRGAFVIGLAGTILVTGIAPVMVTSLGASGIPVTVFITITGWILCLLLAELSAMMPDRTGGSPSYAYPAFKDRWPKSAKHINGFTAWAYWLGWFPVAPLNMILASFYITERFHLSQKGITPIHTPISYWTLAISLVGIAVLFIPSYLGIRFGTVFATALALLSMIPMTFLAVSWIFRPSVVHWSELFPFRHLDGTGFLAPALGHSALVIYLAFAFLLTWNVIAMEAAACYIGECKNPDRDAKIALNLEGGYGLFIYTLLPISFILVLGAKALSDSSLVDPNSMFVTFAGRIFGSSGAWLNWLIALMLIIALLLSALNA